MSGESTRLGIVYLPRRLFADLRPLDLYVSAVLFNAHVDKVDTAVSSWTHSNSLMSSRVHHGEEQHRIRDLAMELLSVPQKS